MKMFPVAVPMVLRAMAALICVLVFGTNLCMPQSNTPGTLTNWGPGVEGVRLSITMTNGFVERESTFWIVAAITNSSANIISLNHISAAADYGVVVTDASGKSYNLRPRLAGGSSGRLFVEPGMQSVLTIPVTLGKDIGPGDYTIKAARGFLLKDGRFFIPESNPLKVRIK
jgi:hypothetical protein